MKFIKLSILIIFLIPNQIFGQDCKILNDFNSFRGIKFGHKIEDSILKLFKVDKYSDEYPRYIRELKNSSPTDKYLRFGYTLFSELQIDCLNDGRVFEFVLQKSKVDWDESYLEDSIEIYKNNKLPKTFIKLSEELTSLFGPYTKTTNENSNAIMNSNTVKRIWDCEKNRIELSIYVVTQNKEYPEFTTSFTIWLYITNKELEKIQKFNSLKN